MNWDQVEGQWLDFKGRVREKWAKLTDSDLESIAGKKDRLVGRIQSAYGVTKERVEEELDDFLDRIEAPSTHTTKHEREHASGF